MSGSQYFLFSQRSSEAVQNADQKFPSWLWDDEKFQACAINAFPLHLPVLIVSKCSSPCISRQPVVIIRRCSSSGSFHVISPLLHTTSARPLSSMVMQKRTSFFDGCEIARKAQDSSYDTLALRSSKMAHHLYLTCQLFIQSPHTCLHVISLFTTQEAVRRSSNKISSKSHNSSSDSSRKKNSKRSCRLALHLVTQCS